MDAIDSCGLVNSGASPRSLAFYEQAQRELLCYCADPLATLNRAIDESPDFIMARYLKAYLNLISSEAGGLPEGTRVLLDTANMRANGREAQHRTAIKALVEGRIEAAISQLETLLVDFPRDIVALQVAHLFDFYRGDARNLRNRPARVLSAWTRDDPLYHAVLAMYAFGLEECNTYQKAEETGMLALELNPRDAWAHHAVTHVYEMQGETQKGIDWVTGREQYWSPDNFFAIHNWWHLALFHLANDDHDEVFRIYDERTRGSGSKVVLDLVDASALLWRLLLQRADVGERWAELAQAWTPFSLDDNYAFNNFHAIMAFIGAQQWHGAEEILYTLTKRVTYGGSNQAMTREVGLPASLAFYAFGKGDYAKTIDLLLPIRDVAHHFGGSHAQRDVIDLTLLEAAYRNQRHSLVRALLSERQAKRPEPAVIRRYS